MNSIETLLMEYASQIQNSPWFPPPNGLPAPWQTYHGYTHDGPPPHPENIPPRRLVGYYPGWATYPKSRRNAILSLSLPGVTHLIYAFARIVNGTMGPMDIYMDTKYPFDPNKRLRGNYGQLYLLKKRYPHLRIPIAIGGWGSSGNFSKIAASAAARTRFAQSVVHFLHRWPVFDGIDIDWEYPGKGGGGQGGGPKDKHNFTLLVRTLRQHLGKKYSLSLAVGAGKRHIANIEPAALAPYVDWITVMTYDFRGSWDKINGHHTPLFSDPTAPPNMKNTVKEENVSASILRYLAAGVPAHKLNMGLAFYGRLWTQCNPQHHGEYQFCAKGNRRGLGSQGILDYPDVLKFQKLGAQKYFNPHAKVPFLWYPKEGVFISYDDPTSLRPKIQWARKHHLGGLTIWNLDNDRSGVLFNEVQHTWSQSKNYGNHP
ncbi:glycoside hydrolase family 18 protein [Pasteuria penetrans]|uniref:glycoside hydrolase family 18 protein n=1 Tax=Pasteuria penetrans TaxID=86005 RepID=UPI000FAD5777|nr:glycoside hydrolase family 18 protein [Pasteuria penetrans]